MVYAIIDTGGHQHRVSEGSIISVDCRGESIGETVTFDDVLFLAKDDGQFLSGSPRVASTKVTGVVESETKGKKVRVFMKKRRKGMRRTQGHRTRFTRVRITAIETA